MSTALATLTFDEMSRLAESVAKSNLFGMKTADQALALMAISAAEGVHPALAARDYHVIQGRPTLKADAMLARFQSAGGKMEMMEYTDAKVVAKFSHPQGGAVTIDWTIERAKTAGLTGKDVWKQYPRQMLRARVISEGVRTVFPGATAGFMALEEAVDTTDATERDITPGKPATGVAALSARIAELAPEPTALPDADATLATVNDQILAQLRDVALEGSEKLKAAWNGLPDAMKTELRANLPSLKKAAAEADKTPHQIDVEQAEARG